MTSGSRIPVIGIMQGRLSPPIDGRIQAFPADSWNAEFTQAAAAGFATIEWIYDVANGSYNPIASDRGIERMRAAADASGVAVRSLCADYFMTEPLLKGEVADRGRREQHVQWLLGRCNRAGISRVVLPFVDHSALSDAREEDALVAFLERILPVADRAHVELHLETALPPERFAAVLDRVRHEFVKVNYDSGNSASLGFDPREEFAAYGPRVGSVHVKDRVRGGSTVPLGSGDANLAAVVAELHRIGYCGDIVLQVARGESGDELAWARRNREFVDQLLSGWTWN